jgi:ligand-binding SRPBCC domain-containing protein
VLTAGFYHGAIGCGAPTMQGMPLFERSCIVRAPIADVFAFHLDTRNAARISPRTMPVLEVRGSFPLAEGDEVEIVVRLWPSPFRQTWRVEAERIVAPTLVRDRMLAGPFPSWVHQHRFEDLADGTTRLTDHVDYQLPLGVLGTLADRIAVRRVLERMFRYRHARTRELLERG